MERDILDGELENARDELQRMKLERLCYMAMEIDSEGASEGPDGEKIKGFLGDINTAIIRRTAFWAAVIGLIAYVAAVAGGALALHLSGGLMLTKWFTVTQEAFAAGALLVAAGIANRKLIALGDWASTVAANAAARRGEALERDGDGRDG